MSFPNPVVGSSCKRHHASHLTPTPRAYMTRPTCTCTLKPTVQSDSVLTNLHVLANNNNINNNLSLSLYRSLCFASSICRSRPRWRHSCRCMRRVFKLFYGWHHVASQRVVGDMVVRCGIRIPLGSTWCTGRPLEYNRWMCWVCDVVHYCHMWCFSRECAIYRHYCRPISFAAW